MTDQTTSPAAGHAAASSVGKEDFKVIAASSAGTVFEWFDFFLYGSMAVVISRHFFAGVNESTAFILALLAFAAGFAVRPFGALVFGALGDVWGRKKTFIFTLTLMGAATFAVGLLPTYAQIGVADAAFFPALTLSAGLGYRNSAIADLVRALRDQGLQVDSVDCGGGLGIPYRNEPAPSPAGLAGAIKSAFHNLDVRVALEPGRWLVGPAGVLLTSVILVKQSLGARFVVLDGAMNDLIRPAMYDAWHGIVPVSAVDAAGPLSPADVVGPICESGDTFARNRPLPPLAQHARVAILDAGAYGRVMSSPYNARPGAAEVLVDRDRWSIIRERAPHESLWAQERGPPFVAPAP
jgi:MFS family permease